MFRKSLILIAFLLCIGLCIGSVSAVDETLTVMYCQDQNAYKFSVTNLDNGYVGITVIDSAGTYCRYYPGLEDINPAQAKVALSGTPGERTWDVVNQVDCVISDAAGWIRVGIFDRNVIALEYDMSWQDTTRHYMGNGNTYIAYVSPTTVWFSPKTDSGGAGIVTTTPAERHTYKLDCYNRNFYLDGELISSCGRSSASSVSFFLFSYNNYQDYTNKNTIYGAKYWQSDVLVRDFIPVQIGNGEYCLYEKCLTENVIYKNQGSGTFTGGYEQIPLTYTHSLFKPDVSGISIVYSPLKPTAKQEQAITLNLTSAPIGEPGDEFYYTWYFNNTAISNATSVYEYIWNTNQKKGLYPISCKVTSPQYGLPAYVNSTITFYEKEVPILISIEVFIVALFVLIALFIFGMYIVNKMNVLGFVASGISALTMIVLTVLGAFGNVGNVAASVLYQRNETMGYSTVQYVTTYIDSSLVYISGFIALMMVIILLFVIGKYIATLTVLNREEKEE